MNAHLQTANTEYKKNKQSVNKLSIYKKSCLSIYLAKQLKNNMIVELRHSERVRVALLTHDGRSHLATPVVFYPSAADYLLVCTTPPCFSSSAACAAARRAVNSRKGEQET